MRWLKKPVKITVVIYGGERIGDLANRECVPCKGGTPPLSEEESSSFLSQIDESWEVIENHHLTRVWEFSDFVSALEFTNVLGDICEEQGHHADFQVGWGKVSVEIYTHKIDALTESDFVLAAKFDEA